MTPILVILQNGDRHSAPNAISRTPVVNGPLATLNTTTVPDGLYALRLVVVNDQQQAFTDTVAPIRINSTHLSV
ncbi:MAG: hypothetical protein NZM00_10880 [Anaerolinea sp.]|nr:hypothetical protein [Anaerolinea sp.]